MWITFTRRLITLAIMWMMSAACMAQAATLELISSAPINNQIDVSRVAALQLQFSAALSAYSVRADTVTLRSEAGIQKASLRIAGNSIVIQPLMPLLPWTTYTLTATSLVATTGEPLTQPVTLVFKTLDGAWQAPSSVDSLAVNQFSPTTATNNNGVRFVTWLQSLGGGDVVWVVRHVPNAAAESPLLLASFPQNYISGLDIKVDERGNAIVVWVAEVPSGPRVGHLWASHFTAGSGAGSGWSAPQIIDGYAARSPTEVHLALDHAGNAFVLWQEFDCCAVHATYNVKVARYTLQAGWSKPIYLDASEPDSATGLIDIQVDSAGNAYATWVKVHAYFDPQARVRVARYAINVGWSEAKSIGGEVNFDSYGIQTLAVNPRGEAFLMWWEYGGLYFARANEAGNWSAPTLIDSSITHPPISMALLDNDVAFAAFPDGVKMFMPDHGWWSWTHPLFSQPIPQSVTSELRVVADVSGNALVAWTQTTNGIGRIYAKRYRADHGWLNSVLIDTGNTLGGSLDDLFLGATGSAEAVWWQSNDLGTADIKAAVFK